MFFCSFFCQLGLGPISRQPAGRFTPNFACGRTLVPDVSFPLLGVSGPPGGGKKGEMKFSWKTYVECEWRFCVISTDALACSSFSLIFLFVPCGGLSWLQSAFYYTLNTQYRHDIQRQQTSPVPQRRRRGLPCRPIGATSWYFSLPYITFDKYHIQGGPAKVKPHTFLLITFECIGKIQWFLAHVNYIQQQVVWWKFYANFVIINT